MLGVDRSARLASVGRHAMGDEAEIRESDLVSFTPPPCEAIALLDSLHYLSSDEQTDLLDRVVARLVEGGVLLVREANRSSGWRFRLTRAAERLASRFRGETRQGFTFRPAEEWSSLLTARGLEVTCRPASAGTPFANVLLVATRPTGSGSG
jgi:trans-aconitate methyltransferase